MNAQVTIAVIVGLAAIVDDLWRRKISNWISAAALVGGLGWQLYDSGLWGLLYGLGGAVVGGAVFLIFYVLGGMGGGDVKLMTGFGALLGTERLLEASLWTAGLGGIMALGVLAFRAARRALTGSNRQQVSRPLSDADPVSVDLAAEAGEPVDAARLKEDESIPYAPAIALGVWLSLVPTP